MAEDGVHCTGKGAILQSCGHACFCLSFWQAVHTPSQQTFIVARCLMRPRVHSQRSLLHANVSRTAYKYAGAGLGRPLHCADLLAPLMPGQLVHCLPTSAFVQVLSLDMPNLPHSLAVCLHHLLQCWLTGPHPGQCPGPGLQQEVRRTADLHLGSQAGSRHLCPSRGSEQGQALPGRG